MIENESELAVNATNLFREYAPGRGVCGVDLEVKWGESFALLGRNGSGKSTLTRLLVGLESPDKGTLEVAGRSMGALRGSDRVRHLSTLGVALDTSVHWKKLSGFANSYFVASAHGLTDRVVTQRVDELMGEAAIREQSRDPVSKYSFGMRRKLSIVEAVAHDPRILVLDEPTSGVDPQFTVVLGEMIRERSRNRKTTWIASNDPDWVAEVAGRVAFVEKGRIEAIGTIPELLAEVAPYQELTIVVGSASRLDALDDNRIKQFSQSDQRITIVADDDPMFVPGVMEAIINQGARIASVEVRRSSLRDAFLMKTGEELSD